MSPRSLKRKSGSPAFPYSTLGDKKNMPLQAGDKISFKNKIGGDNETFCRPGIVECRLTLMLNDPKLNPKDYHTMMKVEKPGGDTNIRCRHFIEEKLFGYE